MKPLLIKAAIGLAFVGAFFVAITQWERANTAEDKYNDTILRLQHVVAHTDTLRKAAVVQYERIATPLRVDTIHDSVSVAVVKTLIAAADTVVLRDSLALASRDSLIHVLEHPPAPPRLAPSAALLIDSRLLPTVQLAADYRVVGKFYITGQIDINQTPTAYVGIRVRF